jgi:hypothetical protein
MTEKKPGENSSSESGKKKSDEEEGYQKKKQWFHDSSQTESDALRAMIGKQVKKEDSKESEEDHEQ